MSLKRDPMKALSKKGRRGFRGYPIATVAFYGPDAGRASKVAVGIVLDDSDEVVELERWWSEKGDVRRDPAIGRSVEEFIRSHGVRSVVMTDGLLGCPHEEGEDYPEGEVCPECPYWADRDRFTGEKIR